MNRTEQWAYSLALTPITPLPSRRKVASNNAGQKHRIFSVAVDVASDVTSQYSPQSLHAGSPDGSIDDSPDSSDLSSLSFLSEDAEDIDAEEALSEPGPEFLDDPWSYTFKLWDEVWIRTAGGNWQRGRVSRRNPKTGATREKEGLFYHVTFRMNDNNVRKYFSPLNGEIKPNTARTRTLLRQDGWDVVVS